MSTGMRLAFLTCTGDRPRALSVCRRFVERGLSFPDDWVVVDDGRTSTFDVLRGTNVPLQMVRRPPMLGDPRHTLPVNLLAAIPALRENGADWITFFEDDDWYSPAYIECVRATIASNPAVVLLGQKNARYYRICARQYQFMGNDRHASLCATVMHKSLLDRLESLCHRTLDPFLDIHLWSYAASMNLPTVLVEHPHVVGIKQMPGRMGSTYGWRGGPDFINDPSYTKLAEWVGGADAGMYARIAEEVPPC